MLPLEIFERYFSGYSAHAIEQNGTLFPTVEHAYHCARYSDQKIIEEIRTARSPLKAWQISQRHKASQTPDFNERKITVMELLMRAKLEQHDDVRQALIDSRDLEIRKHITTGTPSDGFWDDGHDGKGCNHIGNLWMEIRKELQSTII